MSTSQSKPSRSRRAVLTDVVGVAEMLDCQVQAVLDHHRDGKMPAPLVVAGEQRWRVAEIRHWVKEGCPDRKTWEGRFYR